MQIVFKGEADRTMHLMGDARGNTGQFADFGQWEDWLSDRDQAKQDASERGGSSSGNSGRKSDGSSTGQQTSAANSASSAKSGKKKLSYNDAREYAAIEGKVEASDERLATARDHVENPAVVTDATALQAALVELDAAQHEHDALYARWAELTEKAG